MIEAENMRKAIEGRAISEEEKERARAELSAAKQKIDEAYAALYTAQRTHNANPSRENKEVLDKAIVELPGVIEREKEARRICREKDVDC